MTATSEITDWRALAACMTADPDLFFPISPAGPARDQVTQAKAICAGCQVQRPCLDFALRTGQVHGVWGGTTEEERQRLRRQQQRAARSQPGNQAAARQRPGQRGRQRQRGRRDPVG